MIIFYKRCEARPKDAVRLSYNIMIYPTKIPIPDRDLKQPCLL